MATRYFGERIKRNEDPRLLTGQGLYVDDVYFPQLTVPAPLRFAVSFAAVAVLLLFFYPSPFLRAAQQSVATLFASPGSFFGLLP